MKKNFFLFRISLMILIFSSANFLSAQEKVKIKDVRKNCVKATYALGISSALKFIKQEPDNFESHYLLAQCYVHSSNDFSGKHNEYIKQNKSITWTEKEYQGEIDLLKSSLNSSDSAIYFYTKSNELIDESFLKKNTNICKLGVGSCYNEFSGGVTLENARKFISAEIKTTQDVYNSNKKVYDKIVGEKDALNKKVEDKKMGNNNSTTVKKTSKSDLELSDLRGNVKLIKQKFKEELVVDADSEYGPGPCDYTASGYESFSFNKDGNLVDQIMNEKEKITYKYDSNGNLIEKSGLSYREVSKYDDNGFKIEFLVYSLGNTGKLVGKTTYKNNELGYETERNYSNMGAITTKHLSTYDSKWNLIQDKEVVIKGNYTGNRTDYKYNSQNDKIETQTFTSKGVMYARDVKKYDTKHHPVEETSYNVSKGTISTRYTSKYDDAGNLIEYCQYYGTNLAETRIYQYEFDSKGNWIKKRELLNNVPQCEVTREIIYFE